MLQMIFIGNTTYLKVFSDRLHANLDYFSRVDFDYLYSMLFLSRMFEKEVKENRF